MKDTVKIKSPRKRVAKKKKNAFEKEIFKMINNPFWGGGKKEPWSEPSLFHHVKESCPTLCDPMNCSTPGLPGHH